MMKTSLCPHLKSQHTKLICRTVHVFLVFFLFFFFVVVFYHYYYLGVTARQDYFTHFVPSQSKGGAKAEDSREKPSDHPQAELGLSHT